MKRDIKMKSKLTLVGLGSLLAACNAPDSPSSGVTALHVPVVSQTSYVFDMAAPAGMAGQDEADRLDKWFQSLGLGYGDSIYVDGTDGAARGQVAAVAAQYGMLISEGAPVTNGYVDPGMVRVVVTRSRAHVPGCPDWTDNVATTLDNSTADGFGCAVNGNLAAMVADPEHLLKGAEATGDTVVMSSTKAIDTYRAAKPTGAEGLPAVSSQSGGN